MEQRSDEWYEARLGKVTASRLDDVMATIKKGEAAARANYRIEIVSERLTGERMLSFTSQAMQWGVYNERAAIAAYELETGRIVSDVGFVVHPVIADSGASPDGLVGDDGLIEIKCPETKAHVNTLLQKKAPAQYIPQIQWQMACTGRKWVDFVSYDPRMPSNLKLAIIRVDRDDELIEKYEQEVINFLSEVSETINLLLKEGEQC